MSTTSLEVIKLVFTILILKDYKEFLIKRVLCSGKTLAFQANDASSILATRSNQEFYVLFFFCCKKRVKKTLNNIIEPPIIVTKEGFFSYHKKFKIIEIGGIK